MDEPSVLDYVKAKLAFWKTSDIHFPALKDDPAVIAPEAAAAGAPMEPGAGLAEPVYRATVTDEMVPDAAPTLVGADAAPIPVEPLNGGAQVYTAPVERARAGSAWLVLLPALTALLAQSFLEPPNRTVPIALALYAISALFVGIAFARGLFTPIDLSPVEVRRDPMDVRWIAAMVGVGFAVFAFLTFTKNRFNVLNVTLWVISLALFLFAFWQRAQGPGIADRLRGFALPLREPGFWNIRITRWMLLVALVLAVVLFFRFNRFTEIPLEMVSDHAEKLYDVYDVLNGKPYIFFERNTGREPFQFYWTALVIKLFNLDVTFDALKLGTVLTGLIVLYYMYKLGYLIGGRWLALIVLLLVGVSYWANIISRISLRFPLYPLFVAPLLYHLIRALRMGTRNDFIFAGIWLGIGLNGYTSSRIVPLLVVIAIILYILHEKAKDLPFQAIMGLLLIAFFALVICLPLMRYFLENPDYVMYRSMTRLGDAERPLPGAPLEIFGTNMWRALTMFFYDNGIIWVHSIPNRPAFDVGTAAFFFIGLVLLLARYVKQRTWEDLLLLVSIPVLLLPSALSLAFPEENPSLNRTAGVYVPALLIAAIGVEAFLRGLYERMPRVSARRVVGVVGVLLLGWIVSNNYDLFFKQYADLYRASAWNTREVGEVVHDFASLTGTYDTYYVVGFPHWLDSRQVAIFAGHIERDPAIMPELLNVTTADPRMKMFIVKPEDEATLSMLRQLFPLGTATLHQSTQEGKNFVTFLVPENLNAVGIEPLP